LALMRLRHHARSDRWLVRRPVPFFTISLSDSRQTPHLFENLCSGGGVDGRRSRRVFLQQVANLV